VQCKCSAGRKDQQQHGCKGNCLTDAVVAVAEPWTTVQDIAVHRMVGSRPSIRTGTNAR